MKLQEIEREIGEAELAELNPEEMKEILKAYLQKANQLHLCLIMTQEQIIAKSGGGRWGWSGVLLAGLRDSSV